MEFRKAIESDIDSIIQIIGQAQAYLKEKGVDQWQNNYPNVDTVATDIKNGHGYVLEKNKKVIGTVAVIFGIEKTYNTICLGAWLTEGEEYATIHRIAVDTDLKGFGMAAVMVRHIEAMCLKKGVHSIKVDTHRDNKSMLKMLEKNGFQYCGIIYLEDESERIAFEKLI